MYNSNICDEELNFFHKSIKVNEKFKLEDILSSDLFYSEVINDSIVRFFPLFYSDEIVSNDDCDNILDNKCVICDFNESKVFNFKSNLINTDDILVYGYWKYIDNLGFYFVIVVYNNFFKTIPNVKIRVCELDDYIDEDYVTVLTQFEFQNLTGNACSLEDLGVDSKSIREFYTDKNGIINFYYGDLDLSLVFEIEIDGKTRVAIFYI